MLGLVLGWSEADVVAFQDLVVVAVEADEPFLFEYLQAPLQFLF